MLLVAGIAEKTQLLAGGAVQGRQALDRPAGVAAELAAERFNYRAEAKLHTYLVPLSALITLSVMSCLGLI